MLLSGKQASCLLVLPFGKAASLCKTATVYLCHIYGFYKGYSRFGRYEGIFYKARLIMGKTSNEISGVYLKYL